MKNKLRWFSVAGVLVMAMIAHASIVVYNAVLVNVPALAYDSTYTINLQSTGIGALSAQAVYSSATVANVTFQDGAQSTGSFTVNSFSALSTASATNSLTILSTSGLTGAAIILPGYVFMNGVDWATQSTVTGTAVSIKNALAAVPFLSVSTSGGIVYATATAGAYYNSLSLVSSNGNISVAKPFFTGGQDNAIIRINGVALRQGAQWTAATSNSATAASLASAINSSSLSSFLSAQAVGSVVTSTSTRNGTVYNYLLQTSTPAALSASGSRMVNGANPAFTLGSSIFTTAGGSTLSTALPILYTAGSVSIGGLIDQTTYFSVPTSGNSFMLAKYSTSAVAGNSDLVVVTSTNSQTASAIHTYTLSALPITGTPGLFWSVSNDGTNWINLAVDSITINSYSVGASTIWPFGYIGTQYLRLNVVAPTTGGLALRVNVIGTN